MADNATLSPPATEQSADKPRIGNTDDHAPIPKKKPGPKPRLQRPIVGTIVKSFGSEWKFRIPEILEALHARDLPVPNRETWSGKAPESWLRIKALAFPEGKPDHKSEKILRSVKDYLRDCRSLAAAMN
jgi:hypothetical protein